MDVCVVLMAGANIHGRILIEEMIAAGMPPDLVINEMGTHRAARLATFLQNSFDNPSALDEMEVEVATVPGFASDEAFALMAEMKPRFLINGGCGIFHRALLDVATPLNAHPGILPAFRGLDPVLWSLAEHQPVGATVHVMTEGVDEGQILISRQLPWRGAGSPLELRLQCMRWGGRLLAEYLANPAAYTPKVQDAGAARYFGAFPEERQHQADAALRHYVRNGDGNAYREAPRS